MDKKYKNAIAKIFEEKGLPELPALTFSDVTIQSKWSDIEHRSDIKSFKTYLSKNFSINIPLVSANMGDVTNWKTAIALAREGALGFIPQFTSLEDRLNQVRKVKRADNIVIDDPITIFPNITLGKAKEIMDEHQVSSALVVDKKKKLVGILAHRDYQFKHDNSIKVSEIMKKPPFHTAQIGISQKKAIEIFDELRLEKLPLVDKNGILKGLMSAKDILKQWQYPNAVKDKKGRLCVGAALRLSGDYLNEAKKLLKAEADVLLLDTARAGSEITFKATREIKKAFPNCILVVGNIDNPEHVYKLAKAGADCLKIGIGPGSRCKTRIVAGVGIPQITAIMKCYAIAKELGIKIIADGGIKDSGDLAKALGAGADATMVGSLLAGTDEAPGMLIKKGNQLWKRYRGSASLDHQLERIQNGSLDVAREPEGESADVAYSGSIAHLINNLMNGLRSSMSYVGARTVEEFKEKVEFVWISNSGFEEGKPMI